MSVQTLYSAATGMQALETKLDVIANNLANVNTTAFKKGRANFEDLFYRHEIMPGADPAGGGPTATGTSIGHGTRVSSVQTNFQQGAYEQTGNRYDVAIQGPGFFQVIDASSGSQLYTRSGNFSVNANGALVLGSATAGRIVQPQITIPNNALDVSIGADGNVLVRLPGQNQSSNVGQIQLNNFVNPEGLLKLGENLYEPTDASGTATQGNPGATGMGTLQQGALEASNVEPVQEMIDLITTQRSFELNSQAIKAGDEILQMIANLRRF